MASSGRHHVQKRKRIYQKREPYPHPRKWIRVMDRVIYAMGIIGPIMTIPQLTKIWLEQSAAGVSVISWATYLLIAVTWTVYGILHKEKPIIFTYAIWILLDILIVFGVILYG